MMQKIYTRSSSVSTERLLPLGVRIQVTRRASNLVVIPIRWLILVVVFLQEFDEFPGQQAKGFSTTI